MIQDAYYLRINKTEVFKNVDILEQLQALSLCRLVPYLKYECGQNKMFQKCRQGCWKITVYFYINFL